MVRLRAQESMHLLLRGNIVTPDGVLRDGWLDILNGRILHIERERPDLPGVPALDTSDYVFPGFIDLHNHPAFNVFPRLSLIHIYSFLTRFVRSL